MLSCCVKQFCFYRFNVDGQTAELAAVKTERDQLQETMATTVDASVLEAMQQQLTAVVRGARARQPTLISFRQTTELAVVKTERDQLQGASTNANNDITQKLAETQQQLEQVQRDSAALLEQ